MTPTGWPDTPTEAEQYWLDFYKGDDSPFIAFDPQKCPYPTYRSWSQSTSQCKRRGRYGPGALYCKEHAKIIALGG